VVDAVSGEDLSKTQRAELANEIRSEVDRGLDRFIVEITLVDLAANGAGEALIAALDADGEFGRWMSLYGNETATARNMAFLKSKGLVSFPLRDYRQAEITPFGIEIARELSPVVANANASNVRDSRASTSRLDIGTLSVDQLLTDGPRPFTLTENERRLVLTSDVAQTVRF
jgi:hypothetical protein